MRCVATCFEHFFGFWEPEASLVRRGAILSASCRARRLCWLPQVAEASVAVAGVVPGCPLPQAVSDAYGTLFDCGSAAARWLWPARRCRTIMIARTRR